VAAEAEAAGQVGEAEEAAAAGAEAEGWADTAGSGL
jgi:hypothetical protein